MLDELLGKAKEDGPIVQEVVTHLQFSIFRLLSTETTARSKEEQEWLLIIR